MDPTPGFINNAQALNIIPTFKPRWALELLHPFYGDTRKIRDTFADISEGGLPSDEMAYSPADIAKLRERVDERFRNRTRAADQMPPVLAFRTSKGGVGKTTTCANVGSCAASLGYRVLMIDAAPQASLSVMCQVDTADRELKTLLHAAFEGVPLADLIRPVIPNGHLHLIPSDNLLAQFDYLAMPQAGREYIIDNLLSSNIETLREYDIILIDCDPGTSQINFNVLCAASHLSVLVGLDGLDLKALEQLTSELEIVNRVTRKIPDYFFVANKFFPSYQHTIENLQIMKEQYGEYLLKVTIPDAVAFSRQVKLAEMSETKPLFFHPKEMGKTPWRAILELTRTILLKTKISD